MSENSDAIVIVVSEETGAISVAENGVLKSGFTRESLHQLLTKRLITASEETTIGKVARKIPFLKRHHKDDGKEKDNAQKSLEEPTAKRHHRRTGAAALMGHCSSGCMRAVRQ